MVRLFAARCMAHKVNRRVTFLIEKCFWVAGSRARSFFSGQKYLFSEPLKQVILSQMDFSQ
jgi:hypothetical protein